MFQREYHKSAFASATGAATGALIACSGGALWSCFGFIIGAFIGYLAYDWKAVARAIQQAYKAAEGWKPAEGAAARFFHRSWRLLGIGVSIVLWHTALKSAFGNVEPTTLITDKDAALPVLLGFIGLGVFLCTLIVDILKHDLKQLQKGTRRFVLGLLIALPPIFCIAVVGFACYCICNALIQSILTIPLLVRQCLRLIRFMRHLVVQVFIRIHDKEQRLVCAADALLGTAVGAWFGHTMHFQPLAALGGAIAGYGFGYLHAMLGEMLLKHFKVTT